jgi:lysophospholipase L1-like esterase
MRLFLALAFALATYPATALSGGTTLPRDPSQLLLIGDSVTAGMYFLSLDQTSMSQAWSGQLVRRLGFDPPRAPYPYTYPINHLGLAEMGFTVGGSAYLWEARRVFQRGGPQFAADDERTILAIPGQTVHEALVQSSRSRKEDRHSPGWTFANILLPENLSLVETVEQWNKRPEWIVLFTGNNDLLSAFGMVGDAKPPAPGDFARDYAELVTRLRARMAPGAPPCQFIVLTLPDVTRLPFLQPLPEAADNGNGVHFPAGTRASAFLIPFRTHFQDDEVFTPEQLAGVRDLARQYNAAIRDLATRQGLSVIDTQSLLDELAQDSTFATTGSPYFSPDLDHPSFRTHAAIADKVADLMSSLSGEQIPPLTAQETPLPHSGDFSGKYRERVATLMHLATLGLETGPLPPVPSLRLAVEAAGQFGSERIGDATVSLLAGVELAPCPVGTHPLLRIGASVRATAVSFRSSDVEYFPQRSLEARLGMGWERIGAWTWSRLELGGLLTLDNEWDGGLYARGEWRWLYAEAAGRGWWFDRIEAGVRFGAQPGRPGRNGN